MLYNQLFSFCTFTVAHENIRTFAETFYKYMYYIKYFKILLTLRDYDDIKFQCGNYIPKSHKIFNTSMYLSKDHNLNRHNPLYQ